MPPRPPAHGSETGEASSLATVLHDALSPGILVVDGQQRIVCCTVEAERLLGLPSGQAVGSELAALPAAVQEIIREVLTTRQTVTGRVVALAANKDAPRLCLGMHPFQSRQGSAGILITVSNVAVTRRLEDNLHRLDRLASVGTLSAGLAHEIRNALVGVKTFVELLLEKNRDAELAETVGRELKRMDVLVSHFLRFRATASPALARLRAHDVLDHSLRMLQHLFETKSISIHRRFAAECQTVNGDDYQLEQAFVNLFFNALEAMGPNGTLTVTTENLPPPASGQAPRQLCITIADDGIGISRENMDRLFVPFFTTKQHGTGLGLAITRRIIREHHGDITVQSQPNCGAKFSIFLPVLVEGS